MHARLRPFVWICLAAALVMTGCAITRGARWDPDGVKNLRAGILQRDSGYEGAGEYAPRGVDTTNLMDSSPLISETVRPDGAPVSHVALAIRVLTWHPEQKAFDVTVGVPTTFILRLLNYPAWRVQVNGKVFNAGSSQGTGQMLVSVPAGSSHIEADFIRTPDRLWGGIISAIALGMVMCVLVLPRRPARGS